jgi:hypothetical protein
MVCVLCEVFATNRYVAGVRLFVAVQTCLNRLVSELAVILAAIVTVSRALGRASTLASAQPIRRFGGIK